MMRIFNEVRRSYSIPPPPPKIFTQVIHIPNKIEIRWKEFKLSSGHRRRTNGGTDEQGESSITHSTSMRGEGGVGVGWGVGCGV